ncbi:MAG: transglutaminase domain-containing protein, partial [Anaerohalosphaera sp.]|nr:transglutaminase domain-containing protein [Anaerohalosphaera sp.]
GSFKADQQFSITFKAQPAEPVLTSASAAPIYPEKAVAISDTELILPDNVPDEYKSQIAEALSKAKPNVSQLIDAIKKAPPAHTEAVCFLIANMPDRDLTSLTADYILENVKWAYKAKQTVPWAGSIPQDIFLNDILPYASINERRDNWRKDFYERFYEVVKDCKTPGEAAIALNYNIWKMTNVKYSTKRRKADQSPYETMEQGLASCTGLSVLYIDACRALYVPARFAGIPQWTTKRGNHSWAEVWDNGWHFTGAFEPAEQLDRGWFSADASKADPTNPMHCIYATSFKKTDTNFPCVWNLSIRYVSAVDVTDRYISKEKTENGNRIVAIILRDKFQGKRITADVTVLKDGKTFGTGKTRTETNDTNDFLEFKLAPNTKYDIRLTYKGKTISTTFATTQKERQNFDFVWENLEIKPKGEDTCEL